MIRQGLAGAVLALIAAGAALGAGPSPTPPKALGFTLGALRLAALSDSSFSAPNDGKTFGVDAGPAAVARTLAAAGMPTDKVPVAIDALLVRAPGRLMLFDTGLGPRAGGVLPASLLRAGVTPTQVTDIFITHTHLDHVGGLATADGALAFPQATIRMSSKEWAWMQSQPGSAELVKIIAPRVKTFEAGEMVAPGVAAVALDGHTPGHVGYEIVSHGARLLDIGDAAHSTVISLAQPDWTMGFDSDPAVGKTTRRALLTRLAGSRELIFAPHFPFPGVGRIVRKGNGFAWAPEPIASGR